MRLVLPFADIDAHHLPAVGGKGANLGVLTRADFPVPPGFCVTTAAYEAFLGQSEEMDAWFERLARLRPEDVEAIRAAAEGVRAHLLSLPVPSGVEEAITAAWTRLGEERAYAVRSSATAEDLPGASFAGQQDTLLNVRGREALLDAVRRCWVSLFTDRAIAYRAKNGFDHRSVRLAVVVQEMVFPEVSGILFTADPVTGNRRIVSIDASHGLGEALVSGRVTADLYQVRDGRILERRIARKTVAAWGRPEGGTVLQEVPEDLQTAQALPDERILELAELGRRIERHYGAPQDIEWCYADGRFFIVQSRPITTLYPVPRVADDRLHVFFSFGHQQMMTDAIPPLGISVLRTLLPVGKRGSVRSESTVLLEAGGRLFADPTELLLVWPTRRVVPRLLRHIDERIGSALEEVMQRPSFQRPADPQVKRAVHRVARAALAAVLPLLFGRGARSLRDPAAVRQAIQRELDAQVQAGERWLAGTAGAERVRRIQEYLGTRIVLILRCLGPYLLLGVGAFLLTQALIRRWLGEDARLAALNKSLPGNVTSEMGLCIGDLADLARPHPPLLSYLRRAADESFWDGLAEVPGAEAFREALRDFMRRYGMRCPGEIDITRRRWRETPTALVPSVLSQVGTLAPGEHRRRFADGAREAEEAAQALLADVRRLRGGWWKVRLLRRLIHFYRGFAGLRETPKYTIIRHFDLCRRAILEEARGLVARGVIDREDDVFFLSLEELAALLEGEGVTGVRGLVAARRQEHAYHQTLTPPRVMTSEGEVIEGTRGGRDVPAGALVGAPVSAGIAEGRARVVLRPEDAKLSPGDILVAPFTDPGWTPLFQAARALVMEVGGMMTHGAVVAREYGIPAVVGVDGATRRIPDGALIRVDGGRGYVQILRDPEGDEGGAGSNGTSSGSSAGRGPA
ncbi:phosphoenolpyruvate synthase [Alicyclobacillus macrosporangiidus]|uniref:phosphoenolpyruvate synthase n=1 Tax=Alicyclobacillus macrosporangiidus TaxID=392015 RepID=UPI0026ED5BD9|nr:phosphoenolpyruvate synthase [Alicyclobacillus macrosporangiidus]